MDLNVLIVDDSAAIRKILVRVLGQTDLPITRIHEASDGQEALNIVASSDVSLILCLSSCASILSFCLDSVKCVFARVLVGMHLCTMLM
jgi:PleD family two-component response regulator